MYNLLLLLLLLTSHSIPATVLMLRLTTIAQLLNVSSSNFPYRYDIPNSPFHLNIGFGLPSQRLDARDLHSLLVAAQAVAKKGSHDHGSGEPLPAVPDVEAVFHYSLGAGITISITEGHYAVTWGILEDVLRGLKEYLVDGRRPYWTRVSIFSV